MPPLRETVFADKFLLRKQLIYSLLLFCNNSKELHISFHPKLIDLGIIIMAILLLFLTKIRLNKLLARLLNRFLFWAPPNFLLIAKAIKGLLISFSFLYTLNNIWLQETELELLKILEKLKEEIEFFNYAERLFLPLLLLLARIALPDLEEFLFLKPCLFFLFLFDILIVTFISFFIPNK